MKKLIYLMVIICVIILTINNLLLIKEINKLKYQHTECLHWVRKIRSEPLSDKARLNSMMLISACGSTTAEEVLYNLSNY